MNAHSGVWPGDSPTMTSKRATCETGLILGRVPKKAEIAAGEAKDDALWLAQTEDGRS